LFMHLRLGLPSGLSPSGFPTLNQVFICYHSSQISELCYVFKTSVTYLHAMILPCILVTRQSMFTSRPNSLLESIKFVCFSL
jgi:hypothetical protein